MLGAGEVWARAEFAIDADVLANASEVEVWIAAPGKRVLFVSHFRVFIKLPIHCFSSFIFLYFKGGADVWLNEVQIDAAGHMAMPDYAAEPNSYWTRLTLLRVGDDDDDDSHAADSVVPLPSKARILLIIELSLHSFLTIPCTLYLYYILFTAVALNTELNVLAARIRAVTFEAKDTKKETRFMHFDAEIRIRGVFTEE